MRNQSLRVTSTDIPRTWGRLTAILPPGCFTRPQVQVVSRSPEALLSIQNEKSRSESLGCSGFDVALGGTGDLVRLDQVSWTRHPATLPALCAAGIETGIVAEALSAAFHPPSSLDHSLHPMPKCCILRSSTVLLPHLSCVPSRQVLLPQLAGALLHHEQRAWPSLGGDRDGPRGGG